MTSRQRHERHHADIAHLRLDAADDGQELVQVAHRGVRDEDDVLAENVEAVRDEEAFRLGQVDPEDRGNHRLGELGDVDPGSRQAVADSLGSWKGSIIFVSHDTEFVEQLAPTKVLLMPDGDVDYFSEDWLDLVSMS